nr:MAG TPA: hypothetical protein [Caudoviricetes sp.]
MMTYIVISFLLYNLANQNCYISLILLKTIRIIKFNTSLIFT